MVHSHTVLVDYPIMLFDSVEDELIISALLQRNVHAHTHAHEQQWNGVD
jgi:hypothetical protein